FRGARWVRDRRVDKRDDRHLESHGLGNRAARAAIPGGKRATGTRVSVLRDYHDRLDAEPCDTRLDRWVAAAAAKQPGDLGVIRPRWPPRVARALHAIPRRFTGLNGFVFHRVQRQRRRPGLWFESCA